MTTLMDMADFRAAARAGNPVAGAHVFRVAMGTPKLLDDDARTMRFVFSDGSVDRMGDTIDPTGWQVNAFNQNPVALWAHDSSAPPIGRASQVVVEDGRLMGNIEFAAAEIYPFADTIFRLTKAGFLNAVSVGFIPLEYDWSNDEDRPYGLDFKQQELIEISVCPVPANGNALVDARAKGIDTRPLIEWAERALEGGGKIAIPRAELEKLRRAAGKPARKSAPKRRDDGGMSETDPASGGAVVATCGRAADDECGMIDPQECAVHMTTEEDKRLADMIARAVTSGVSAALKKHAQSERRRVPRPRRREADDTDVSSEMAPEHAECIKGAMEHLEAMGDALDDATDHHEKAMSLIGSVCDDLDTDPEHETGVDPSDGSDKSLKARLRRAQRATERLINE